LHNVPGRKSDVQDCEWLRELHSVGLLRASFRPSAAIVPLRAYLRQRETLVQETSTRILRMQKALTEMNVMLHVVVTDITGQTGLRIVRGIVAGERDPERLAQHRDPRCRASHAEIVAALTGNYRAEHLFALKQNFAAYEFLLQQIAECDSEIEALLSKLADRQPPPTAPLPNARSKRVSKHTPAFDLRGPLHRLTGGTDLSQNRQHRPICRVTTHCRDRYRHAALGPQKSTSPPGLHWPQQQDLRRAPAQFQDPAFR
jgi:transposase